MFQRILIISDTHAPWSHPDCIPFLRGIRDRLSPDRVVHIGDEIDAHSWSFHSHDPDLFSPGVELQRAITALRPMYELFPFVDVIESNHGSLVYRKGKFHGLPRDVFKSYREIIEAPKGWNWHKDLTLTMSDGNQVYFHHGKSGAAGPKLSQNMSMSCVQGHYHSRFDIQYWANPNGLYWDMRVGCLISDKELCFEYNKTTLQRPIIGCGVIIKGHPKLVPMVLGEDGRWIGEFV